VLPREDSARFVERPADLEPMYVQHDGATVCASARGDELQENAIAASRAVNHWGQVEERAGERP
jgi:hypothetical protein